MADIDLATATVEFVALAIRQDGPDPDTGEPDQVPLAGVRVKLAPSPRKVEVAAAGGEPARTITLRDWILETDEAGVLSNPETPGVTIQIVASDAFPGVVIEWTSTVSAPDTGVPDIVKRWLAPTGATVDLTTVTSIPPAPSPLPDYLAAVADARAARDVALSAAQRAEDAEQGAGGARTGAVAARDEAVPAAATAVAARDLAIAARDATLAASTIVGAGRPDQLGSMTAPVKALVDAATSGAEFRSTNGPQGAWVWRKRGTAWVCVEGDTGAVDLTSYLSPGWEPNPTVPYVLGSRSGQTVTISGRLRVAASAPFIGAARSGVRTLLTGLPSWIQPSPADGTFYQPIGHAILSIGVGAISHASAPADLTLHSPVTSSPGVWAAGDTVTFYGQRVTRNAYPLTI